MKHVLALPIVVLGVCGLITAGLVWLFPSTVTVYIPSLFTVVFGMISCFTVLSLMGDEDKFSSLVLPKFFHPATSVLLMFGNIFLFMVSFVVFNYGMGVSLTISVESLLLVYNISSAALIVFSLLFFAVASKLTPKQGTMVVDEYDLYYLPGDVLPRLSSRAQIITPETKITIPVLRSLNEVSVMASFFFAPWVFTQEARQKLPGSMNYSTLLKGAENEYNASHLDVIRVQDIWRLFWFEYQGNNDSPYMWNNDPVISVRSAS